MFSQFLRDPRRLQVAFVAVMLLFATTLGSLGWRLIENDRALDAQRAADQRETAADLVEASLNRQLSAWRQRLGTWLNERQDGSVPDLPARCVVVRFDHRSVRASPERALIYSPTEVETSQLDTAALSLVNAARAEQTGTVNALAIYARLERHGAAPVAGMPAALVAKLGRIAVYERAGDAMNVVTEARSLASDLETGRWPVSFATYKYLAGQARDRLPASEQRVPEAEAITDSVTWLWDEWSRGQLMGHWVSRRTAAGPVLLVWTGTEERGAALAAGSECIEREMLSDIANLKERRIRLSLESKEDGALEFGTAPAPGQRAALRLASDTGLPWTIRTSALGPVEGALSGRRYVLVAGVTVLVAFVLTGAWFVGRAVTRELEVARLKSDFVAAVSHEFRTPLTTLVQLSELLKNGRVASDSDRQAYYDLLNVEGSRLRRLVERLLNFGQVESGRAQYRFAQVDVANLARTCVAEFVSTHDVSRHSVECSTAEAPSVEADQEALTSVLWNLLENALKYSPDGGCIRVDVAAVGDDVQVCVRDEGLGIPASERSQIFEPFVRGALGRDLEIRGSGVGLALVRSIVRAHGGDIAVESEPGAGSTFRIHLPAAGSGRVGEGRRRR